MENVTDALKIAGAVLLFVMALTVAMFSLSGARAASEAIIYTKDEKNYYSYVDQADYVENGRFKTSREVTMDAIIPTLYRYYTEQYRVEFCIGNKDTKLVLYTVTDTPNTFAWRQKHTEEDKRINYLDLDDEMERNEPWQGSRESTKSFVDMLINGPIKIKRPDGTEIATSYTDGPLNRYKDSNRYKFREELGEYTYENNTEEGNSALTDAITSNKQKKRVVRYILLQD